MSYLIPPNIDFIVKIYNLIKQYYIGDKMTWAVKLKVSTSDCEKVYETGKNKITSININSEDGLIEIAQDMPEWDHIIIPFSTMIYFKYKAEEQVGSRGVVPL